jgi:hypothetical protein
MPQRVVQWKSPELKVGGFDAWGIPSIHVEESRRFEDLIRSFTDRPFSPQFPNKKNPGVSAS